MATISAHSTNLTNERVLVVDDDPQLRRLFQRLLTDAGFRADVASDGAEASRMLLCKGYSALVTDITMPKMGGLDLLRFVRVHDLDVPVILVAGAPDVQSATQAIGDGAFQMLAKPVAAALLVSEVRRATRVHMKSGQQRRALRLLDVEERDEEERSQLKAALHRAMDSMWMAYQPIVSRSGRLFGYEALLRSDEESLPGPMQVFEAATRLGRVGALGLAIRERVAEEIVNADPNATVFVNLDASDLMDDSLLTPDSRLHAIAPRVILEITERAKLHEMPEAVRRVARLRDVGFRLAIDDLGAGYSSLSSIPLLCPEIVKLDMSIVRGVHLDKMKRTIVRMVTAACRDLGIAVVAEGIETEEEKQALFELRCDYFQGYLIGRPGRAFPSVSW